MASDHNLWGLVMAFQASEILEVVVLTPISQSGVFTLGTDWLSTHLENGMLMTIF